MSEVYGTGYGSAHDWRRTNKATAAKHEYRCQKCGEYFAHEHGVVANIWTAIKRAGVREECARSSLGVEIRRGGGSAGTYTGRDDAYR